MRKMILLFVVLLNTVFAVAQSVLFIGVYNVAEPGVDYWCRKMEMVKQLVASEAEAQQLSVDFKTLHKQESPFVKIVKRGAVVIFDFIKDDKAFHCKYRVIGWREGKTVEEARQNLNRDRENIRKK